MNWFKRLVGRAEKAAPECPPHDWQFENIVVDAWTDPNRKERITYWKCARCFKTKDHKRVEP